MKLSPLQFSFGLAVLCHAIAFGVIMSVIKSRHEAATLTSREETLTLTLVAAPALPAVAPVAPVVKLAPLVKIPQPVMPVIPVAVTPPEPTPQAVPPKSLATVAVTLPLPVPVPAASDNSSPKPGLDAITQKAQVAVHAAPDYLDNPQPSYPLAARRRHEEGLVLLTVQVTAQGRATKVEVRQSSGYPLLDEAALDAVRDWEFVPARVGSISLESQIEVPVRFKLTD